MRITKNTILIMVFVLLNTISFAQDQEHPIDLYLENCLSSDSTTAGMATCTSQAYTLWDQELNTVYTHLLSQLPLEGQELLRGSQRQWLAFRETEFDFINSIYDRFEGTMYTPMRLGDRYDFVRERVLQLTWYLKLLEQGR